MESEEIIVNDRTTASSKWMSWALRHDPAAAGISMSSDGWVAVSDLLAAASRHGHPTKLAELRDIVANNDKKRFALSDDQLSIRANQGHSITVELKLPPLQPPDILYHGTATRFIHNIRINGLVKGARNHVHLSTNIDTAHSVGSRHGKPIILKVDSAAMSRQGHLFYRSDNGVWLVDAVPPMFLAECPLENG